MNNSAFCTVITKNRIAFARTLAQSIKKHHPNTPIYTLIIDEDFRKSITPAEEAFDVIPLADLKIQNLNELLSVYSVGEFSRILKPFLLYYLLEQKNVEKLLYLDSDMLVKGTLDSLFTLLSSHDIILTPHITKQLPDDNKIPSEKDILRAGTYNGGFIALRNSVNARAFATWWSKKVRDYGFMKLDQWSSADQKWLNLAPSLFPNVHILTKQGYNTAYWNIPNYSFSRTNDTYTVDGKPLKIFHFSGYQPEQPKTISKHQNRLSFSTHPVLKPLFELYRAQLLKNDYTKTKNLPYLPKTFNQSTSLLLKTRQAHFDLWQKKLYAWLDSHDSYITLLKWLHRIREK